MIRATLIALWLASGAQALPLAGKWECTGTPGPDKSVRMLNTYSASGFLKQQLSYVIRKQGKQLDVAGTTHGRWRLDGDTLHEIIGWTRVTEITLDGRDMRDTGTGRRMAKALNRPDPERPPRETISGTVRFAGDDTFTLQGRALELTCHRR